MYILKKLFLKGEESDKHLEDPTVPYNTYKNEFLKVRCLIRQFIQFTRSRIRLMMSKEAQKWSRVRTSLHDTHISRHLPINAITKVY